MNYNVTGIEIITALAALILLVTGLILPSGRKKVVGYLSLFFLAAIFAVSLMPWFAKAGTFYGGFYVSDALSDFFKKVFIIAAVLVTAMSLSYVKRFKENRSEFFALIFFALLGMMLLSSSNDLVTLYVGLEVMALSFVILAAYQTDSLKSSEAGMKYIFLSAMSSGILLYGMSILYGMSGSTTFADIAVYLQKNISSPLTALAVIMVISGFAFKISVVPFHMWSPDVYEGAPTPVTAFLVMGSKAAGFAVLIRLFIQVIPLKHEVFTNILVVLAALTMVIGNLVAIPQVNIKRMLAYSSIAQAGYILLGLIASKESGIPAMLYYILLYIFANSGAFAAIIAFSNHTGSDEIKDYSGMWKRSPMISIVLLVSLLSMAGIPPAAGFIGKFWLFASAVKSGYTGLVFLGIAMSFVSAYYYIVVIRTVFTGDAENASSLHIPFSLKTVLAVSTVMTLLMGVFPAPLINWVAQTASLLIK